MTQGEWKLPNRNCYHVLGVDRSADAGAIRAAYIRLARRHHPDTVGQLSNRLRDVQFAYRCLSDPLRRDEHDRAIAALEREHTVRGRTIQRRLDRYDLSHLGTARVRRPATRRRWSTVFVLTGALLVPGLMLLHYS